MFIQVHKTKVAVTHATRNSGLQLACLGATQEFIVHLHGGNSLGVLWVLSHLMLTPVL